MTKAKPMPARTLKALKASIVKWRNVETGDNREIGSRSCPLCWEFNRYGMEAKAKCVGCPVYKKTRLKYCANTPYEKAYKMIRKHGLFSEKFLAAGKAERIFLESLLPKGEKA